MKRDTPFHSTTLLSSVLLLAVSVVLSGCTLLGLGAAAGAAVGGCALLDENEDETVSAEEFSAGVFQAWDDDDDAALSEAEFDAGVAQSDAYSGWSGEFDNWDTDDGGTLSEQEFTAAVSQTDTSAWADRQCDDLGL